MIRFSRISLAFLVLCTIAVVTAAAPASARVENDYIIVLDTSSSMAGKGGKNIFDSVRSNLNSYVDKIEEGDTLTFVTFDALVKLYPTVLIEDVNDRDIVKKYLSVVEAKGEWTYTIEMVRVVMKKAQELQADGRQIVIVIMSDAQDDPPPSKRSDRLTIADLGSVKKGQDWFIYLIDISTLQNNPKIQKMKAELSGISKYTQVMGADKGIQKNMEDMRSDVAAKSAEIHRPFFLHPLFIAGIVVLILAAVLLYVRKLSKLKIKGVLAYWNSDIFDKEIVSADLTKLGLRRLTIGKDGGAAVRLRDYSQKRPISLEAMSFGGVIHPVIVEDQSAPVEFLNGKKTAFLSDGDSFKCGGYTFIYREKA